MRPWEMNIRRVVPYVPGDQPAGDKLIKLNTNENPYPPAPGVERALKEMDVDRLRKYPDPSSAELVKALAEYYGVGEDQVFVGVGSDDVIAMSFLTFFNSQKPVPVSYTHLLQYKARLLELKTEVVLNGVEYGNGMIAFLMITAAVVIGVSSFAYLHNKKKVDFYHSIPVRREALFGAQFSGGIFMVGAAYGFNLLLLTGVALSYGVPAGRILGAMAGGWALNMLYYEMCIRDRYGACPSAHSRFRLSWTVPGVFCHQGQILSRQPYCRA